MLACAGDVLTMATVAAAQILRDRVPHLAVRVVNVVDLMALVRPADHPHGIDPTFFSELFTDTTDVVFSFHGFPAQSTSFSTVARTPTGPMSAGSSSRGRRRHRST